MTERHNTTLTYYFNIIQEDKKLKTVGKYREKNFLFLVQVLRTK